MGALKNLWPFGTNYEVRMLNRDSAYIIEDAEQRFPDERLREMANTTRTYLAAAEEQLARENMAIANVLPHFQNLHRTARKERRDMGLSAVTLVIIHLKARKHGDACEPARAAISAFVEHWASEGDEDDEDAPTGSDGTMEA